MSCDVDYHRRLALLAELMEAHPNSRMKSLQQTALKQYPVASREMYRHCMSARFALKAADIVNQQFMSEGE